MWMSCNGWYFNCTVNVPEQFACAIGWSQNSLLLVHSHIVPDNCLWEWGQWVGMLLNTILPKFCSNCPEQHVNMWCIVDSGKSCNGYYIATTVWNWLNHEKCQTKAFRKFYIREVLHGLLVLFIVASNSEFSLIWRRIIPLPYLGLVKTKSFKPWWLFM